MKKALLNEEVVSEMKLVIFVVDTLLILHLKSLSIRLIVDN